MTELFGAISQFFIENGYTVELSMFVALFAYSFPKRKIVVLRFILSFCVLLAFSLIWNKFNLSELVVIGNLKYMAMYVIAAIGVLFCVKAKFYGVVHCIVGGVSFQHCAFRLTSLVIAMCGSDYTTVFAMVVNILINILTLITEFFLFTNRVKGSPEELISKKINVIIAAAIIIISVFLQEYVDTSISITENRSLYSAIAVYDIISCLFVLSTQYSIYHTSELKNENAILEHLLKQQESNYVYTKQTIETINMKCHDMKQLIAGFDKKLNSEELKDLEQAIAIYDSTFKTGNEVLDVLLADKGLMCERMGIKVDCIIDGGSINFISAADICSLFGNALDNAIESLSKVMNKENRILGISVRKKNDMVTIHIENCFEGNIQFEGDLPRTTKIDARFHGYGMRSIQLVIEKYKGNMSVMVKDNVFNLNIILPSPKKEGAVIN